MPPTYFATIAIYAFAMIAALTVLFMSIYVRKAPKSLWFSYMSLAIFIFAMGYLFEITAEHPVSALVATKLQYIGVCFISPFLLLFILEYCGHRISKWLIAALMVIPAITLVLVQTWELHMLYYDLLIFVTEGVVSYLKVSGAPLYYVFFFYTHCLCIAAAVVVFLYYKRSTLSVRKQSITLIIAILIPVAGNIISIFKIIPWVLDLTPIVLSLTCILLGYSIFRQGLYRIVPIAREQIVETMSDGFILVDMQGHFIDANSAATRLLPQLNPSTVGTHISELDNLAWLGNMSMQGEFDVTDPVTNAVTYHRISKTIVRFKQQEICNCFMIFDITDTKQLLNEVSDLAQRDSLTGLAHRGAFYDRGWPMLQNAQSACLLMMDLDFFKTVNDRHGHLAGDEVLKTTARMLDECLRSTDLVARYGGEEFCALLTAVNSGNALALAERIRKRVEQCVFQSPQGEFRVTLSIGVAVYDSAMHTSIESLVADADAAMYAAKDAGRNGVVLASPKA